MIQHTEENALAILSSLADERFRAGDYIKAIIYYQRYLEINPNNADIYNAIGYSYRKIAGLRENVELQIENFEKALAIEPNHKYALRNLALVYPFEEKYQEAVNCFEMLFKMDPVPDDYVIYSYLKIRLGDFDKGWKAFEYRFDVDLMTTKYPQMIKPKWQGQDLSEKTLLVHFEQGFGDSIQFCRYISILKPLAKKIIFRVQDELLELIKLNLDGIEVVGVSTPLEALSFDYHIPLMSILSVIESSIDSIPQAEGYINADKNKIQEYKDKFFDNDCFKIGISWYGMKNGNRRRNVPLNFFYELTKLKKVKVYSLQKGFGAEQLKDLPAEIKILDLGKTFNDFSDTAAAMANLDLFVTSDNCVLNLAGAMGKNAFLMLNKYSEWRWFLDEDKTPWYDSVKIFKKQNENDSWNLLMAKIIEIIKIIKRANS